MEEKTLVASLDNLNSSISNLPTKEDFVAMMKDSGKQTAAEKPTTGTMEDSGMLGSITNFKPWDIPVGSALVGGFVAVVASELVDGFLVKQPAMVRGVVKLAGAGASIKWGKKIFGDTGSKAVAILLAFDGLRDIVPVDTYAAKLVGSVSTLTNKGLAQRSDPIKIINGKSAVAPAADYYSRAQRQ